MMSLLKRFYLLTFLFAFHASYSQQVYEEEQYYSELTGGLNFNTNASLIGGLYGKYSREIKRGQYHYFGLEIINVKHPKEQRIPSSSTGNLYIFSKVNNLFAVRTQYGREIVLFRPAEEEGVQVNLIGAAGPTFGLLKPYMVEYDYVNYTQVEPFNPEKLEPILGSGGILSGLDKTKIMPGINIKAALGFEFSQFRGSVTGVEVGGMFEAYPKPVNLVQIRRAFNPPIHNSQFFSSIFINIFFGTRN